MSTENKEESFLDDEPIIEDSSDVEEPEDQIEEPEVKQKAKKFGHLSREQYIAKHGSDEGYKDEKEFVEFGDSYSKLKPVIDSMKAQLEKRDHALEAMLAYQQRTSEREYKKARADLDLQLDQARQMGDVRVVEELTKTKTQLEANDEVRMYQEIENKRQTALNGFLERNKHWYNDANPDLMERVKQLDTKLRDEHGPIPFDALAKLIETEIRDEYPDRVVKLRPKGPPVVSSNRSAVNKSSMESGESGNVEKTYRSLGSNHQAIYEETKRIMKKGGIEYSKADFLKRLKEDGEL